MDKRLLHIGVRNLLKILANFEDGSPWGRTGS